MSLRRNLIRLASQYPPRSTERRSFLALLRQGTAERRIPGDRKTLQVAMARGGWEDINGWGIDDAVARTFLASGLGPNNVGEPDTIRVDQSKCGWGLEGKEPTYWLCGTLILPIEGTVDGDTLTGRVEYYYEFPLGIYTYEELAPFVPPELREDTGGREAPWLNRFQHLEFND